MTEPTELMPCPFCGGGAHRMKHSAGLQGTAGYDQWHGVSCATCNACVGASDRRFRTPAEAIAAWNRRAPQPTQAQAGAVESAEFDQFLSDVLTAAGLVTHGKQCKALGERIADMCMKLRIHGIKGGQHG